MSFWIRAHGQGFTKNWTLKDRKDRGILVESLNTYQMGGSKCNQWAKCENWFFY